MPSFLKLATFGLDVFHCFQMYIRNLRRSPSSQDISVRFHISYLKITNPTADKYLHFLHHSANIASTVSLYKKFQHFLCFVKRLSVYTDKDAIFILAQTESKKLKEKSTI